MINSSKVDALLWKGSPKATKVQRVGIVISGLAFLSIGVFFLFVLASEQPSPRLPYSDCLVWQLGTRITLNAFNRQPKPGKIKKQ